MKQYVFRASCVALAIFAAACSSSASSSKPAVSKTTIGAKHADTTVTLWAPWGGQERKSFEATFKVCEKQYPWLHVKFTPKDDLGTVLRTAVKAKNPPDVALTFDTADLATIVHQAEVYSLDEFATRDNFAWTTLRPAAEQLVAYAGKHYGIPVALDTYGLLTTQNYCAPRASTVLQKH